ncbi:TPA: GNAT family N-acetyltransferase [Streptococcus suis]|uniref:GNAT family N-acetyltransferase n=1 Tax=Streptococcus suis TaxID=1307 RepID=UPI001961B877|nr:GNAT family N-acetyltransferase [Streptococcus suis]MBM7154286.1 GNAT family N-acetyltransferase [Streptococcus suis]MDG4504083.1 GNAT family N-acetyltransferase [Streptococcus suis]MDW8710569.1 GNAT family N-acetyltransferase [Streptococcus suis]HEL1634694.1 GNAT family N-acetyltransferase [Streptococcus suis]HEM5006241.1 GNAT family N-acetyltransferase [Streptococcus suis]
MAEQMRQIARLFGDWPETIIWTCLEGAMGDIYVDDSQSPQSVLALYGRQSFFGFLAGQPHRDLLKICEEKDVIMVPQTQAWSDLIEETYPDGVYSFTRYATKKNTVFDRGALQEMVDDLPESFDMKLVDRNLYEACLVEEWSRDLVGNYIDVEQFLDLGLGYVILHKGQVVSGASSYASYSAGIEIEVDTREDYRGLGLAKACAAQLILACLDRGLYPSWDAHTLTSLKLAEKLGYQLDKPYRAYEWR